MKIASYSPILPAKNVSYGRRWDREDPPLIHWNHGKTSHHAKGVTAMLLLAVFGGTYLSSDKPYIPEDSVLEMQPLNLSEKVIENIKLTPQEQEVFDKITGYNYELANVNQEETFTRNLVKAIAQKTPEVLAKQYIAAYTDDETFEKLQKEMNDDFSSYEYKSDENGKSIIDEAPSLRDCWTGEILFEARKQGVINKEEAKFLSEYLGEEKMNGFGFVVKDNPNQGLYMSNLYNTRYYGYYITEVGKDDEGHIFMEYKKLERDENFNEKITGERMKYLPDNDGKPIEGTLEVEPLPEKVLSRIIEA